MGMAAETGGGEEQSTVSYSVTMIGTFGGRSSVAQGMNENGDVVGWSDTAGNAQHAFVNIGGMMTDLNDLLDPADQARWILKQAFDINDAGKIGGVGNWFDAGGNYVGQRAFRLTPGATTATIDNLGTLVGNSSSAMGLNESGEVEGTSLDANGEEMCGQVGLRCARWQTLTAHSLRNTPVK